MEETRGATNLSLLMLLFRRFFLLAPRLQLYARSEPGEPPEYCTVFHHMVKSAGSTVKSLLHSATRKEGLPRPV
ncbi:unnamed protein product [Ectocarpus sp. CCAP 1310/34]|nr:unnamed protein product [Ectocarpus sp. CCAP 1310/34]